MSKRKGRKYELQLKREVLEPLGLTVVDVHANAGLEGEYDADLLVSFSPDPDLDTYMRCEAKYRGTARGFAKLYSAHLDTVGLGTTQALLWSDGVLTGGVLAWLAYVGGGECEVWERGEACLNSHMRKWLDGVGQARDVVMMRSRESQQWICLWRAT